MSLENSGQTAGGDKFVAGGVEIARTVVSESCEVEPVEMPKIVYAGTEGVRDVPDQVSMPTGPRAFLIA